MLMGSIDLSVEVGNKMFPMGRVGLTLSVKGDLASSVCVVMASPHIKSSLKFQVSTGHSLAAL